MKYQRHSETSKAAAEAVNPDAAETTREAIFAFIDAADADGATDEEIQLVLRINANTERPRRIELVELGRVKDSGLTRKTEANRSAVVWVSRRIPGRIKIKKPSRKQLEAEIETLHEENALLREENDKLVVLANEACDRLERFYKKEN